MPHGFFRQEDADNAREIYDQKEYEIAGTQHTSYKLENVTNYIEAIDYIQNVKQTDDFGVLATVGWRDEFGVMQYRNTNTIGVYETGTLMAHISGLLDKYGLDEDSIDELILEFQGEM